MATMINPDPQVEIRIDNDGWRKFPFAIDDVVRKTVKATVIAKGASSIGEISILLTDDDAMAQLNKTWRGKEGSTNVLAFPASTPGAERRVLLGDVVVALETMQAQADAAKIPQVNHLKHLLVHGLLHLLGYDHKTLSDAHLMETVEVQILAALGVPNPYIDAERSGSSLKRT